VISKEKQIEFFDRLYGKEGCDFKKVNGKVTWKCKGGLSKALSVKILEKMKVSAEDAAEFLTLCTLHGGHCDCEILFNARDKILEVKGESEGTKKF
jgi:hypothetical protein